MPRGKNISEKSSVRGCKEVGSLIDIQMSPHG